MMLVSTGGGLLLPRDFIFTFLFFFFFIKDWVYGAVFSSFFGVRSCAGPCFPSRALLIICLCLTLVWFLHGFRCRVFGDGFSYRLLSVVIFGWANLWNGGLGWTDGDRGP